MSTDYISLDGEWNLRWCDEGAGEEAGWPAAGVAGPEAIPAAVPGMTHLDLLAAGKIPDPLLGRNAEDREWMEDKDWWYSTTFDLPANAAEAADRIEIVFEGLDCFADVWLNGEHVGSNRNALVEWRADVTDRVRPGENLLVVRLDTGFRWALRQDLSKYLATSGREPRDKARLYLRHSQFSFRWDWAPRLVTCGIWRPARIELHRDVVLRDVCIRTRLAPGNTAVLTALLEVDVLGDRERDVLIDLSLGDAGGAGLRYTLAPGFNLVTHEFTVGDPILWWPNGLGEPYLYDLSCRLIDLHSDEELDATSFPYGIREIAVAQEPLPADEGQGFTFIVNGVPVFAKGANWVPCDSFLSRVTPERYEALLSEAAAANFNMLRVWGGATYEADAFWDACDRLGLMIWLDFQFSCAMTPGDDPAFVAEVAREADLVVRRLRNHPSLALWCGNNENQGIYRGERGGDSPFYDWNIYHDVLPRACATLDPTRYYWPSSPYGGPTYGDWDIGDTHSWQVSLMGDAPDGLIDYRHYRHDRSKFASEYGFLAPPVRATLEDALPQNELSVGSPSWQFHANKFETGIPVGGAPSVFRQALEHRFGRSPDSLDLDTFIALTQSWQAEAYRYSLSHFRRRKFLTSGTLFWMYDDCWVATSGWTIIDSSLRRKPSYYAVRRVYAPEMLSFAEDDAGLSLWLVNDHLQAVGGELEYGFGSFSGQTTTLLGRASYVVPANRSHHLLAFPLSDVSEEQKADRFYWARWLRDGELLSWQHHWLAPWKDISLADPGLEWQLTPGSEDEHFLEIGTKGYAWMVEIAPGDLLDPEDNFFDLTPGQSRTLRIYAPRSALDQLTVTPWNHFLLPRPGSR